MYVNNVILVSNQIIIIIFRVPRMKNQKRKKGRRIKIQNQRNRITKKNLEILVPETEKILLKDHVHEIWTKNLVNDMIRQKINPKIMNVPDPRIDPENVICPRLLKKMAIVNDLTKKVDQIEIKKIHQEKNHRIHEKGIITVLQLQTSPKDKRTIPITMINTNVKEIILLTQKPNPLK